VGVRVSVEVAVGDGVCVAVSVGVEVLVAVLVALGVHVGVRVGLGVAVLTGDAYAVSCGSPAGCVGVGEAVEVDVKVGTIARPLVDVGEASPPGAVGSEGEGACSAAPPIEIVNPPPGGMV
jgi:hypothetical protein